MTDEATAPEPVLRLVRLTPKRAPFRRANLHFPKLDALTVPADTLDGGQMLQLDGEPLIDVDVSADAGATWTRFEMPDELRDALETGAATLKPRGRKR